MSRHGQPAGDDEARSRGTQKTVQERMAPPTFPLVIEMRERAYWVTHYVEESVDSLLNGSTPVVQVTCDRVKMTCGTCCLGLLSLQ